MSQPIKFREPQYSSSSTTRSSTTSLDVPPRIGPWVIRRANSESDVHWSNTQERKPSLTQLIRNVDEDCDRIQKLARSTMVQHISQPSEGRRRTYPCEKTTSGGYCQICGFVGSRCTTVKEEIELPTTSTSWMSLKSFCILSAVLNLVSVACLVVAMFSR